MFCAILQHFKLLVEDLQVKGEGKVKKAMKESFWVLNEVSIEHLRSCYFRKPVLFFISNCA